MYADRCGWIVLPTVCLIRADYNFILSASISDCVYVRARGGERIRCASVMFHRDWFTSQTQTEWGDAHRLRTDVNTSRASIDLSKTQPPRHFAPPSEMGSKTGVTGDDDGPHKGDDCSAWKTVKHSILMIMDNGKMYAMMRRKRKRRHWSVTV